MWRNSEGLVYNRVYEWHSLDRRLLKLRITKKERHTHRYIFTILYYYKYIHILSHLHAFQPNSKLFHHLLFSDISSHETWRVTRYRGHHTTRILSWANTFTYRSENKRIKKIKSKKKWHSWISFKQNAHVVKEKIKKNLFFFLFSCRVCSYILYALKKKYFKEFYLRPYQNHFYH